MVFEVFLRDGVVGLYAPEQRHSRGVSLEPLTDSPIGSLIVLFRLTGLAERLITIAHQRIQSDAVALIVGSQRVDISQNVHSQTQRSLIVAIQIELPGKAVACLLIAPEVMVGGVVIGCGTPVARLTLCSSSEGTVGIAAVVVGANRRKVPCLLQTVGECQGPLVVTRPQSPSDESVSLGELAIALP